MDSTLFVLMILSRIVDRRRRRRFAPYLTRSSTRTTDIHAIKAALRSVIDRKTAPWPNTRRKRSF